VLTEQEKRDLDSATRYHRWRVYCRSEDPPPDDGLLTVWIYRLRRELKTNTAKTN